MTTHNFDARTVEGFGLEWQAFDQSRLTPDELRWMFEAYFGIFPFETLPANAEGFDLGCGSGRWAELVLERVGVLHCIDPAEEALNVARKRLGHARGARFHHVSVENIPLANGSQDFGYSLGVLHHIPDPALGLAQCVRKLKPRAPFLLYLYYDFDNRPAWFRYVWKTSDVGRRLVSKTPFRVRKLLTGMIAAAVYWPLARTAKAAEHAGVDVRNFPLATYRNTSFYTMRTDAHDRFGTRIEHRFSRAKIAEMMTQAGLTDIEFSPDVPHWVACGRKA